MADRTIKLVLAYDGTDFSGWQRQDRDRSVQAELEAALGRIHKHPVAVTGAGRTDSGVHARGQVASFVTDVDSIPEGKFLNALNALLPPDLRVIRSERAADGFSARFDARARTYRYFLLPREDALPTDRLYSWVLPKAPDSGKLNRMAAGILGERDFSSFCVPRDESLSRHRFVDSAAFFREGRFTVFEIRANAFLWKMVRSLVGFMVEAERRGMGEEAMAETLDSRDRKASGLTAPAAGLFLWSVDY